METGFDFLLTYLGFKYDRRYLKYANTLWISNTQNTYFTTLDLCLRLGHLPAENPQGGGGGRPSGYAPGIFEGYFDLEYTFLQLFG